MEKWARSNYQPVLPLGKDGKCVTASRKHIRLSREAAKEGMVLLKNERNVLPLARGSKVALFGKATFDYVKGGSGSGDVTVSYTYNLYDGLKQEQESICIFEELADYYKEYVKEQYKAGKIVGMIEEPRLPDDLIKRARAFTDTAVISICRFQGEGYDGKSEKSIHFKHITKRAKKLSDMADELYDCGDYYLSTTEKAMVEAVKTTFKRVIVVLNIGNLIDTDWFVNESKIQSVLLAWQGGMEGGLAEAEILIGKYNPCGKLADTIAKDLKDYPSTYNFHESEEYVNYSEDIYVGYRYFETIPGVDKKVNYPFGHGLSYTQFNFSSPIVKKEDEMLLITVDVCNIGELAGKEVVQLYYSAPQGKLGKPLRELAQFQKTRLLQPGETQKICLKLDISCMASFDDLGKVKRSAYVLEKGRYHFFVGSSVRNVMKCDYVLELPDDIVTKQLTSKLAPEQLKERMLSDGSFEQLPLKPQAKMRDNVLKPLNNKETQKMAPAVKGRNRYSQEISSDEVRKLIEVFEGKLTMNQFLSQLSEEQVAELLGGQPNTGVANCFGYGNLSEYGIPNIMTADGPAGLRIDSRCGVFTTAWPCATALACTWNQDLVEQVGRAGSAEVKENNIGVWLTPGVNIHRSPLGGRNFEYYSEDPYLTGTMASAMVRGIQSNNIAATVKHFALNNKEVNRKDSDSRASERAIREIYLKAFEIVVKEADPWLIMSSYNIINGQRASENRELLDDILRGEWGYRGCVTTDWWTYGEHYKEVKAGNDVKMGCGYPERLLEAMKLGALSREEMEICAKRVLELILKID